MPPIPGSVQDNPDEDFDSNFWLTCITFDRKLGITPENLRVALEAENIESRWLWRPMHMQPVFKDAPFYGGCCAEDLFNNGLCLPSGSILTDDDIHRVAFTIKDFISKKK